MPELTRVPLLIIDDLGMRKLPHTAAEDLLELIMRRYERASKGTDQIRAEIHGQGRP